MERKNASIDRTKQKAMEKRAQKSGPLAQALWNYACYPYGRENWESLSGVLRGIYGKAPEELKTAEEFWNPAMKRAVKALSDRRFVRDMEEITWMRMEGQFSSSMWRRSCFPAAMTGCAALTCAWRWS